VVDGEIPGLGCYRQLVRIGRVVEEVRLAREHRADGLVVRTRQHAEPADLRRRVGEVEADVEVTARLLEVEEITQADGVPPEALVLRAGLVAKAVDHQPVALVLGDAISLPRGPRDRLEARILKEGVKRVTLE